MKGRSPKCNLMNHRLAKTSWRIGTMVQKFINAKGWSTNGSPAGGGPTGSCKRSTKTQSETGTGMAMCTATEEMRKILRPNQGDTRTLKARTRWASIQKHPDGNYNTRKRSRDLMANDSNQREAGPSSRDDRSRSPRWRSQSQRWNRPPSMNTR